MPIIDPWETKQEGGIIDPLEEPKRESIEDLTWKAAFRQSLGNIPQSAESTGRAMLEPIQSPIQTGKAIGSIAMGGLEKLLPGDRKYFEENFDAAIDFFKDRYGSIANFKQTIAKDPVGVLADAASVITPGGQAVRGIGIAGKLAPIVKAGEIISKAGATAEPLNVVRATMGLPFRLLPERIPSRLYQSGAKFSTVLNEAQRSELTKTALTNEIMPTVAGLDKLRDNIDNINTKITSLIDESAATNAKIPIDTLFKDFAELSENFLMNSGTPIKSVKALVNIEKEIRKANEILSRTDLSPQEAQAMKQRIYKELESEYSKTKLHPARVEGQMAVARSAKESLEVLIPEIKQLNAEEASMIELRKAIQRSANRISNRDIMGIGVPLKGTLGAVIGSGPGALAGITLGILDTPLVKSRLAIVLDRLRRQGVQISDSRALAKLTSFQTGRMPREAQEQDLLNEPID